MWNEKIQDMILYEDKEILVCQKPPGLAVQSAGVGKADMESCLKNYLVKSGKIPYLGIIHRLDQPVEGVLVFAKTPEAARNLSRQMTAGTIGKHYLAVTEGKPPAPEGILEDWLKKDGRTNTSAVVSPNTNGAKRAKLFYKVLKSIRDVSSDSQRYLLAVTLDTGRHHQIRVQMAHAGMPLVGDKKYNLQGKNTLPLALCAETLEFLHPKTRKKMQFQVKPSGTAFHGFQDIQ